jgi:hypothetical protein
MAFDQSTRGRLQKLVNSCRGLLSDEFSIQLQQTYGLDPNTGGVTPLARLTHLDDRQRHTAEVLRQTLAHYMGADADDPAHRIALLDRMVREQAFTVLNRLAALLMMEARGQLIESVSKGYQSRGYQLYSKIAGTALGETGPAYQIYLFSVFDELAQELPALFDRYAANGLLFPRETALRALLDELNHFEIEPLWSADETIGWIYQYFNSKEERRAMRDASQAPRNSRELAVRNQFFTPRYVVEFLVDNTLGRLWFNATGGQTDMRDRCQYLLIKPDEQLQAAVKLRDPRTLKLLDPACGSMHFGLYAFDLFAEIYREAWAWEQQHGPGSLDLATHPQAELKPLCQTYEDEAAFLRDMPRLIIEHNIYGVDIDPRAAQIATLALWLRAQRAWHDASVKAKDRPRIGQGHVIAAVAPPAERELRQQFASNLDKRDAELFEKTLQLLKGLPEMGVLLQVERELPNLIRQVHVGKGTGLFAIQEQERWQEAEARLNTALTEFALAAKSTYQGRLFVHDALQGMRLIDLCREVFDVVVMNPPFGAGSLIAKETIERAYGRSKADVCAVFVERGLQLLREQGFLGAITSRTVFFLQSFEEWRNQVIFDNAPPTVFADLGLGVMDGALVEAAAYCLQKSAPGKNASTAVIRVLEERENKMSVLHEAVHQSVNQSPVRFDIATKSIQALPRAPFAYWVRDDYRALFADNPALESQGRQAKVGLQTSDDFRFLRLWWEIPTKSMNRHWYLHAKGGAYAPFYADIYLAVRSKDDFAEIRAFDKAYLRNMDFSFRPGVTWTHRTKANLSFRVLPKGCTFGGKGPAVFVEMDNPTSLLALVGIGLSSTFNDLVELQIAAAEPTDRGGVARSYDVGALQRTPVPKKLSLYESDVARLAKVGWGLMRQLDSLNEISHAFCVPRGISTALGNAEIVRIGKQLGELRGQIDVLSADSFSIKPSKPSELPQAIASGLSSNNEDDDEDDEGPLDSAPHASQISYAVGVVFGRFDWRLATGEREAPAEPEPFDPLPAISPGMLPDGASPFYPHAGILVDDQGHPNDLACLVEEVLSRIGVSVPDAVRRWLQKDFFSFHLQRYSKSRRKAPIYWPLSTVSGSYTLWIYYPSLNNQTLFTAVNDFLDGPNGKLTQVSRECAALRIKGSSRSPEEEKRYETLQTFEQELTDLHDTLLKIAPTYQPNHDDGVQITAAPLWQLFRHKPWQKELKDTWTKLEKGNYDWAHLAMAYWPERVREKCKTEKSFAIAHRLEDLYEEPEAVPKKTRAKKIAGANA